MTLSLTPIIPRRLLRFARTPLGGTIAALLVALPTAGAQNPDSSALLKKPALESLPEVVITGQAPRGYAATEASTATRTGESILDTARSVQVVTQQLLQDRAINDPQEAVQNISGVQRAASFTGVGETYLLRGFKQETLFKDGFRAGASPGGDSFSATGSTDVANLDRVEVLKGPAAILYGRGEPGGIVNYVTKMPTFENRFSLEQSVGNNEFYRTELNANWSAVPDRVAVRLDASYDRSESYIDFVEGERWFVAPAFKWEIGPRTTLTFRGEYSHDDRSTIPGVPYANGQVVPNVPYNRYLGEAGFTENDAETWRGLLQLEHRWNDDNKTTLSLHGLKAKSEGGYFILFNFTGQLVDPVTGDIARAATPTHLTEDGVTARLDHLWNWTIYDDSRATVVSADGKTTTAASAGFTVKNQLYVAAEYDRQEASDERNLSAHTPLNPQRPRYTGYQPSPLFPFPGVPVTIDEFTDTEGEARSLLVIDRLSFGETVYLSVGGRFEWFDATSSITYPNTTLFPSGTSELDDEYTFNPSAGLVVKPARNVSLYASYAESTDSFKNIRAFTSGGGKLDPERSRQYEAGVKVELFGGKVFTTLAAFQIEKTDVAGTDPANPLFSINAGEERSRGIEFDIAAEPIPGWRITANYAYIDSRITDAPLGANVGNRRFGVPENSGGFFTTYEIQDGLLRGLGFGGGMYFSDRVEVDNANTGDLSGWAQTDAVLYYRRDRWRAQLNVKNLFDNEFYYSQNQDTTVQSAPARTVVASLKYEF